MPTHESIGYGRSIRLRDLGLCPKVDHCRIDAGGVPAEWVEATAARIGQPTLVIFSGYRHDAWAARTASRLAEDLAITTRARVFVVSSRPWTPRDEIEDALDAYAWLLGEGVDLETTTLIVPMADGFAATLLRSFRLRGLPVPEAVVCVPAWKAVASGLSSDETAEARPCSAPTTGAASGSLSRAVFSTSGSASPVGLR